MNNDNLISTKKSIIKGGLSISVNKKRYNTSLIDFEMNVDCYKAENGEKFLKDMNIDNIIPCKGSADIYHCGTGRGKTTYILKEIVQQAKKENKCVLMLVHRKCILEQIINMLKKKKMHLF